MTQVLVYGSLMKAYWNNELLHTSEYLGRASTTDEVYDMHSLGAFPGVTAGEYGIIGEMYSVDANTLQRLDWLEGHPSFYERKQVDTDRGVAWMYQLPNREEGSQEDVETLGRYKHWVLEARR